MNFLFIVPYIPNLICFRPYSLIKGLSARMNRVTVVTLWSGDRSEIVLLYQFIGIYTAINLLSWALIRYRLPVDAVLVIFAGLGLADLASRFGIIQRPAIDQV